MRSTSPSTRRPSSPSSPTCASPASTSAKSRDIVLAPNGKARDGHGRHRRQVRAAAGEHARDSAHQDAARRDLHRTDARQPQRSEARRRRHLAGGPGRRIGPARRDLPHLQPQNPRRLPDLEQEAAVAINGQGAESLLRLRRARTDLHRTSTSSSACSTASGSRSSSSSATAPLPSLPCAAVRGS